ncbi:MAG: D-beta-hydroxybutyrate dehydrogenase, partial [uncultured Microvirga sp.]
GSGDCRASRAGHRGGGWDRPRDCARISARRGAGACLRCRRGGARETRAGEPGRVALAHRRLGPRRGGPPLRGGAGRARRPRLPGQQRGHRRADRPRRGDFARGLGPHAGDQHHGAFQLHPARGRAAEGEPQPQHRQPVLGGGEIRLPAALALLGLEMGRDRRDQDLGHGTRRAWNPGQRHPAGRRRGRAHPPRFCGQGGGARRDLRRADAIRPAAGLDQGDDSPDAARRHDRFSRLPAGPDRVRAGDQRRRGPAIARGL